MQILEQVGQHDSPYATDTIDTEHLPCFVVSRTASNVPTPLPASIQVLLVDAHEVARLGLCALLREQQDFRVIGQASTASEAIELIDQNQPDLILFTTHLSTPDELEAVRSLMRAYPQAALVLFAGNVSAEMQRQALRLGVAGYLEQSLPLGRFLAALRAIYRGQRVLGMDMTTTSVPEKLASQVRRAYECQRRDLNEMDIELVRLAADGFSNKEIAALQLLSELHVKRRMQDIYRKLRVIDRAQAVTVATHIGLI